MPEDFNIEKSKSLGLMLVKSFVEQMNGNIEFTSNPGTTFIINIPVNQKD
jgi:two-component sensor histidine kinase